MLVKGNNKLGRSIWGWSIPAGTTCPGKSTVCDDRCYAQKGMFVMPNVKRSHQRNEEISRQDDFVERMVEEIRQNRCRTVRIHIAGDFYSKEYIEKWQAIVKACPTVRFFTYTRSWRIPELSKALTKFVRSCPNLKMWYSADQETGYPSQRPKGVRVAYMSIAAYDVPINEKSDLVFRDYGIRGYRQNYVNGVLVCPPENGVEKNADFTCERCGICWNREAPVPKRASDDKKMPLQMVA